MVKRTYVGADIVDNERREMDGGDLVVGALVADI